MGYNLLEPSYKGHFLLSVSTSRLSFLLRKLPLAPFYKPQLVYKCTDDRVVSYFPKYFQYDPLISLSHRYNSTLSNNNFEIIVIYDIFRIEILSVQWLITVGMGLYDLKSNDVTSVASLSEIKTFGFEVNDRKHFSLSQRHLFLRE